MSLEINQGSSVVIDEIPATYEAWNLRITKTSSSDGTLKNIIVNGHKAEDAMDTFRVEYNYESEEFNSNVKPFDPALYSEIMDLVNGVEE